MKNKGNGRRVSLFYALGVLAAVCFVIVAYIGNSIQINRLAVSNNLLREEIKRKTQANSMLATEVEKLSSFNRISDLASRKFSLKYREASIAENKKIVLKKSETSKN